ncbi:MAG: HAMP domain-containing histidine kinase, partial [Candidatus Aureabacteria bacterium]|nr:HAMP domain-containing histidine kinase [Candidatus Auribacterota bacterium]
IMEHEIRNPLGNISMTSEVIKLSIQKSEDTQMKEKVRDYLDKIITQSQYIVHILKTTRGITRLEQQDLTKVYLKNIMNDAILATTQYLSRTKYECDHLNDANKDILILADTTNLVQVMTNLIRNAYEACEHRDNPQIRISIEKKSKTMVHISITDNGVGITEETLKNLFQFKFTTKGTKGSGIGLYFSKLIMKLHGGDITVFSQYGRGSTFTVTVPLYLPEYDAD